MKQIGHFSEDTPLRMTAMEEKAPEWCATNEISRKFWIPSVSRSYNYFPTTKKTELDIWYNQLKSWILSVSEYYSTTKIKNWTSDWHRLSARGARYRHGRGNFFGWKATDIRQIPVTFCWFSIPWRLQKISTFLLISKSETQAADFHECQQRCVETEGCEHFSFFEDPDNRTIKGYDLSLFPISQTLK